MAPSTTVPRGPASVSLAPGDLDLDALRREHPEAFALIVTDGLLMRELTVASTVAAELAGPGDVVGLRRPEGELVPSVLRFTVVAPSRVVVLDPDLQERLRSNADLAVRLLGRSIHQTERLALHRAVLQLPHVEQRVLAVLWLLAERWGRVAAGGIVVPINLTHQTLGALVGARRPTVSLALKALAAEGQVTRRSDGGWLLAHDSAESAFAPAGERSGVTPLPSLLAVPDTPVSVDSERDHLARRTLRDLEEFRRRVSSSEDAVRVTRAEAESLLARCERTRAETAAARARRQSGTG